MNKLFIISGQSGVGKNTILRAILENHPDFFKPVGYTTRERRPGEIPGRDHYFVYRQKFDQMVKNNEFLEYAQVHGEKYGMPKDQIKKALKSGKNILMEIDVQGANKVKKIIPEAVMIFIKYEAGDLEKHIRNRIKNDPKRGQVSEKEIKKRVATAKKEIQFEKYYDYSVVNPEGHPEKAIEEVESIIENELKNK